MAQTTTQHGQTLHLHRRTDTFDDPDLPGDMEVTIEFDPGMAAAWATLEA